MRLKGTQRIANAQTQQAYTAIEGASFSMSYQFEEKAEEIWSAAENFDCLTALAGLVLISLSLEAHGKGTVGVQYLEEARQMAARMRFFDVPSPLTLDEPSPSITKEKQKTTSQAAWGAFNCIM